jgi:hypothetical protein
MLAEALVRRAVAIVGSHMTGEACAKDATVRFQV